MASKVNLDEMDVKYVTANSIRIGTVVLLRDKTYPCKVVDYSKAKTGKHGSAKIHVVGVDVITGKKYDDIFQSSQMVCVPNSEKLDYDLVFVLDDGFLKLKHPDGSYREDLRIEDAELLRNMEESHSEGNDLSISVLRVMEKELIGGYKIVCKKSA